MKKKARQSHLSSRHKRTANKSFVRNSGAAR
jgi:hypothetical protein